MVGDLSQNATAGKAPFSPLDQESLRLPHNHRLLSLRISPDGVFGQRAETSFKPRWNATERAGEKRSCATDQEDFCEAMHSGSATTKEAEAPQVTTIPEAQTKNADSLLMESDR